MGFDIDRWRGLLTQWWSRVKENLEIPIPNHVIPDLRIFTSSLTNKTGPSVARYTPYIWIYIGRQYTASTRQKSLRT